MKWTQTRVDKYEEFGFFHCLRLATPTMGQKRAPGVK